MSYHQQHQQRCPSLRYDLWEQINQGPERCLVDMTLDDGMVVRHRFADGACIDDCIIMPRVVAVNVVGSLC